MANQQEARLDRLELNKDRLDGRLDDRLDNRLDGLEAHQQFNLNQTDENNTDDNMKAEEVMASLLEYFRIHLAVLIAFVAALIAAQMGIIVLLIIRLSS